MLWRDLPEEQRCISSSTVIQRSQSLPKQVCDLVMQNYCRLGPRVLVSKATHMLNGDGCMHNSHDQQVSQSFTDTSRSTSRRRRLPCMSVRIPDQLGVEVSNCTVPLFKVKRVLQLFSVNCGTWKLLLKTRRLLVMLYG